MACLTGCDGAHGLGRVPVSRWVGVMNRLASTLVVAACLGMVSGARAGEQVTIYRDAYGMPQVFASSNRGVFYGYGHAVASDRLFQMEMLKRTTQGRVAEVLGSEFLELDTHLRTSYDHRAVRRQLAALPESQREILEAYAEGFNARLAELETAGAQALPAEFAHYAFLPEPWTAYDVAMIFAGAAVHRYSDYNSERDNLALLQHLEQRHDKGTAWRIFNASKWLLDPDSPTTVPTLGEKVRPAMPERPAYLDQLQAVSPARRIALDRWGRFDGLTDDAEVAERHRERLAQWGFAHHPDYAGASNYWAMRDLKGAAAALLNGPQFGFVAPSYVYGIGLHGGDFDVVGNTLLALPTLVFAHNDHIAWGSTAGLSDQGDEFALKLDPEHPSRYRHQGDWHELESWQETIQVRDGEPVTVIARRSAQGMVLQYEPEAGVAWARARTWEGRELASMMEWVFLATERTLDAAHERLAAMAININMYTMDRRGNLGYLHAGDYPRRAPDHDPRLPLPGDGSRDWHGIRPREDNPTVRNPEQGYIANWNNRPAAGWVSSDMWTYTWGRADRARILFDLLEEAKGASVEQLRDINRRTSFADINAPFVLPYLYETWNGVKAGARSREALAVLRAWDGQWQADAEGYYGAAPAIMEAWLRHLLQRAILDDIGEDYFHLYGSTNYPHKELGPSLPTSPGIKALLRNLDDLAAGRRPDFDFFNGADSAGVIRLSFLDALKELASQGNEMASWRLRAHPMQWRPYNFRGVPQTLPTTVHTLPAYMNRGSENNLFVATGKGIEAHDVVPPGQSGFLGSGGEPGPHTQDQLALFADFGYKPLPFTRQQVKAAAVHEYTLEMPDRP